MTLEATHQTVDALLPWYANGTLTADEREQVERHLENCPACRGELVLLREVGAAAAEAATALPPLPDALGKTLARIDEWEQARPRRATERLRAFLAALMPPAGVGRLVMVGQFALILVLGALLVRQAPRDPGFTTLSGGDGTNGGPRLTVTFEPSATEGSLRQAIRDVGGTVVSGPSAVGVYVIALPGNANEAAVETAITTLRQRTSVIRFVERQP